MSHLLNFKSNENLALIALYHVLWKKTRPTEAYIKLSLKFYTIVLIPTTGTSILLYLLGFWMCLQLFLSFCKTFTESLKFERNFIIYFRKTFIVDPLQLTSNLGPQSFLWHNFMHLFVSTNHWIQMFSCLKCLSSKSGSYILPWFLVETELGRDVQTVCNAAM